MEHKYDEVWRPLLPVGGIGLVILILVSYLIGIRQLCAARWCRCNYHQDQCDDCDFWMSFNDIAVAYLCGMILFHYVCTVFRSPGVQVCPKEKPQMFTARQSQGGMLWCNASTDFSREEKRVRLYGALAGSGENNIDPNDSGSTVYIPDPKPSFCNICQHPRPPRCHHCSVCGRCILQYDHHCIWVNQCIGYNNYRHFFFMVGYLALGCVYGSILLSILVQEPLRDHLRETEWWHLIKSFLWRIITCKLVRQMFWNWPLPPEDYVIFVFPILIGAGTILCYFCATHLFLVSRATTTLENTQMKRKRKTSEATIVNVFDQGWVKNIRQILGQSPLCWFLPVPCEPLPPYLPSADKKK